MNYNAGAVAVNSKVVGLAPGVNVKITIFGVFRQLSTEKIKVTLNSLHKLATF
jgi:hypothetical protein